jgi:hypothetical protein
MGIQITERETKLVGFAMSATCPKPGVGEPVLGKQSPAGKPQAQTVQAQQIQAGNYASAQTAGHAQTSGHAQADDQLLRRNGSGFGSGLSRLARDTRGNRPWRERT